MTVSGSCFQRFFIVFEHFCKLVCWYICDRWITLYLLAPVHFQNCFCFEFVSTSPTYKLLGSIVVFQGQSCYDDVVMPLGIRCDDHALMLYRSLFQKYGSDIIANIAHRSSKALIAKYAQECCDIKLLNCAHHNALSHVVMNGQFFLLHFLINLKNGFLAIFTYVVFQGCEKCKISCDGLRLPTA